jgi:hypothetical protein
MAFSQTRAYRQTVEQLESHEMHRANILAGLINLRCKKINQHGGMRNSDAAFETGDAKPGSQIVTAHT